MSYPDIIWVYFDKLWMWKLLISDDKCQLIKPKSLFYPKRYDECLLLHSDVDYADSKDRF